MLKKYFLLFITFLLLPLSSGTPLLVSRQLDDNLIASGRSGGGRHSGRSSHHSSSRGRHSHSRTSSARSHRASSHHTRHGTSIPRISHQPNYVYPGSTSDSTVIYGGTPLQNTGEGIPSYADQIPNPTPSPTPQTSSTSDQNENTSQDNTSSQKDDQTPKKSTTETQNQPRKFHRYEVPEPIRKGLYEYCKKKYWDKNETDEFIGHINFMLVWACVGELQDKWEAMMQQPSNQPSEPAPGGPPT